MHTIKIFITTILLLVGSWLNAADFDVIIKSDKKKIECTIVNETMDAVIYTAKNGKAEITLRWKEVGKITYKGMDTKRWQQATAALKNGEYETSARQFSQVAVGEEVWAQAYGAYNQAIALERDGKHPEAAESLAVLIEKHPQHRMTMYAIFRQAVNLALSEGDLGPSVTAIKAWNMDLVGADMEKAIAVLQLHGKAFKKAKTKARSLKSRFKADVDMWLYWNLTWNKIMMEKDSKPDDAIRAYESLYDAMEKKPIIRAQLALELGNALVKVDRADDALYYFLHLNALPFVGTKDLSDARLAAAKIIIARLAAAEDDADKKRIADMTQRGKGLLSAVVKYGNDDDQALVAQTLLDETFPEADGASKPEAEAGGAETEAKPE
ncbi:MAG: hypothetical protein HRU15_03775 [Planctomycetes bacterium]|nr:hypothetical protein [Planctomycetota bacterium]